MSLGSWGKPGPGPSRITDAGLTHLSRAGNLTQLWLYGQEFTDAAIVHLGQVPKLNNLTLYTPNIKEAGVARLRQAIKKASDKRGEPIPEEEADTVGSTDAGSDRAIAEQLVDLGGFVKPVGGSNWLGTLDELPEGDFRLEGVSFFRKQKDFDNGHLALLAKMPELRAVIFYASKMTDEGFATLGEMENVVENVTELHFHRSAFGPKGLAALQKLKKLELLVLWHTDVINDDLKLLAATSELRELTLFQHSKSKFGPAFLTDDCLKHLGAVPNLETLNLAGEQFTDAGLPAVAVLEKLKTVEIKHTKISPKALDELKRLRPRLGVVYDPSAEDSDEEEP